MNKFFSNNYIIDIYLAAIPILLSLGNVVFSEYSYTDLKMLIIVWFVSSAAIFIRHVKHYLIEGKVASITVIFGYILWYTYPAFINAIYTTDLQNEILPNIISNETAFMSLLCIALFFIAWLASSCFFNQAKNPVSNEFVFTPPRIDKLLYVAVSCSLLGLIPYLVSGLSLTQIVSSIFESRAVEKSWVHTANIGTTASPFLYLVQCLLVAGSTLLWTVTQDKRLSFRNRFIIGIVAFLFSLIIFFDQGTRSIIVLVFSPIILSYTIKQIRKLDSYKSLLSLSIKGSVCILVIVTVLQFQMLFRDTSTRSETRDLIFKNVLTMGGTLDYFSETSFAISIVPATHDYFRESVLLQFLVSPVPRFLWPSKPVSKVVWYYTLQRWGLDIYEESGNVFPGIVGQYYMSWGWFGPLILGIMLGWATACLDSLTVSAFKQGDPYIITVCLMVAAWLFLNFRILSPGFLYPVMFAALIVYFSKDRKKSHLLLDDKSAAI